MFALSFLQLSTILILILISLSTCNFQFPLFQSLNQHNRNTAIALSPLSIFRTWETSLYNMKGPAMDDIKNYLQVEISQDLAKKIANFINILSEIPKYSQFNAIVSNSSPKESFIQVGNKNQVWIAKIENLAQVSTLILKHMKKQFNPLYTDIFGINYVLVSAVYWGNSWGFPYSCCVDSVFTGVDGAQQIQFMTLKLDKVRYLVNDKMEIIEIPNGNEKTSMFVILPNERNNIDEIIDDINEDSFRGYLRGMVKENVEVKLPRFKTETSFNLKTQMKKLGLMNAFTLNKEELWNWGEVIRNNPVEFIEKIIVEFECDDSVGKGNERKDDSEIRKNVNVNRPFLMFWKHEDIEYLLWMVKVWKID